MDRPTDYISPAQLAEVFGISLSTVRRRLRDGSIPRLQPGGKRTCIRIPRSVIEQAVADITVELASRESESPSSSTLDEKHADRPIPGPRPKWLSELPSPN